MRPIVPSPQPPVLPAPSAASPVVVTLPLNQSEGFPCRKCFDIRVYKTHNDLKIWARNTQIRSWYSGVTCANKMWPMSEDTWPTSKAGNALATARATVPVSAGGILPLT